MRYTLFNLMPRRATKSSQEARSTKSEANLKGRNEENLKRLFGAFLHCFIGICFVLHASDFLLPARAGFRVSSFVLSQMDSA